MYKIIYKVVRRMGTICSIVVACITRDSVYNEQRLSERSWFFSLRKKKTIIFGHVGKFFIRLTINFFRPSFCLQSI